MPWHDRVSARVLRDGPLENLWGVGGGAGEVQKNIRARENQLKKKLCTPINPNKYSCNGLKKIHTRNLITKKNSCGSKIPLPPHNFSNGLSLKDRLPATLPVITNLINSSFASNCFAHAWMSAVVSQTSSPAILMSPKTPALYPFY